MANPSIDAASACLVYMHHLEYSQRLVKELKAEISNVPPSWKRSAPPNWIHMATGDCVKLEKELGIAYGEATRTRKLVGPVAVSALELKLIISTV